MAVEPILPNDDNDMVILSPDEQYQVLLDHAVLSPNTPWVYGVENDASERSDENFDEENRGSNPPINSIEVEAGKKTIIEAKVLDTEGNPIPIASNVTPMWTVDNSSIIAVTGYTGSYRATVFGISAGSAHVILTVGAVTQSIPVTVESTAPANIQFFNG